MESLKSYLEGNINMGMTIAEKIIARAGGKEKVVPGEILNVKPDITVCHEMGILKFTERLKEIGVEQIANPEKTAVVVEHRIPAQNVDFAERQKGAREFARKHHIKYFFDVGRCGIGHQFMAEVGIARPGILYAADDIHATTLGALGCFAAGFGEDTLQFFVRGEFWVKVPATMKINVTGKFQKGVTSRDLIQKIIGDLGPDGALYMVMEFTGPSIDEMSIDSRMAMMCLVVHSGAKTGIINPDKKVLDYVKGRAKEPYQAVYGDLDAKFESLLSYDISNLEPQLAVPDEPTNTESINDVKGVKIHQGFIGTCAGGRLEDIEMAAAIIKGKRIHPDVRLIVIPATPEVYIGMSKKGLIDTFIESGTVIGPPNCGPCGGGHMGVLGSEEVCISNSTLNVKGRMGSPNSKIYLGSAATVAASCIKGEIVDPRDYLQ
jgi:3-isopropylmalate/(R)-2-methylmalate dehydratase large subunit